MKCVTIYSDGACCPNPGPGGYAAIVLTPKGTFEFARHESHTTSNRMEILAAIDGLNAVSEPSEVKLYSDSRYVINAAKCWIAGWKSNNWRKAGGEPVANVDLWERLIEAIERHISVNWRWVKGHAGDQYNERADMLARGAAGSLDRARSASRSSLYSAINF
jgi:ribonuclease HI